MAASPLISRYNVMYVINYKHLDCVAGGGEFELSIEVLQTIEIKILIGGIFLCSGAFSEISVVDPGLSRVIDSWSGQGWIKSSTPLWSTREKGDLKGD